MYYNNTHNFYKLPTKHNFSRKFYYEMNKNNKTFVYMDHTNKHTLMSLAYKEELINIRKKFINDKFPDLTEKDKNTLLNNLIKSEQFTPTIMY
jgi:hypothetical protein